MLLDRRRLHAASPMPEDQVPARQQTLAVVQLIFARGRRLSASLKLRPAVFGQPEGLQGVSGPDPQPKEVVEIGVVNR